MRKNQQNAEQEKKAREIINRLSIDTLNRRIRNVMRSPKKYVQDHYRL